MNKYLQFPIVLCAYFMKNSHTKKKKMHASAVHWMWIAISRLICVNIIVSIIVCLILFAFRQYFHRKNSLQLLFFFLFYLWRRLLQKFFRSHKNNKNQKETIWKKVAQYDFSMKKLHVFLRDFMVLFCCYWSCFIWSFVKIQNIFSTLSRGFRFASEWNLL